jgi:single-strand DNA-binding protein
MRTTLDATPMTKFQLVVERPFGAQKEKDYFDIIAWRKLAEVGGSYLGKGQLVLVEGRIQNRSFETKEGTRKYVTEIIARSISMLEKGKGKQQAVQSFEAPEAEEEAAEDLLDDDLPF